MKLTPAEFKILNQLTLVVGETLPVAWLHPLRRRTARLMRNRGLISKRAWTKGYVVATALGKLHHAGYKRSHGYGKR